MLLDNEFSSDMRVEKEARSLSEAGFMVRLICSKSVHLPKQEVRNGFLIDRRIDDFWAHPMRKGFRTKLNQFTNELLELEFDAIHCHDVFMLIIGLKVKQARPMVHLVYDSHEYLREWPFYKDTVSFAGRIKGYIVWRYLLYLERKGCVAADMLISTTHAICDRLKSNYHLKIELTAVRNIPQIAPIDDPENRFNLRIALAIAEDELLMVQSGNIYQNDYEIQKTFATILGFAKLHFAIIGNSKRFCDLRDAWQNKPETKGKIHFVEYNQNALFNMLNSCDFGYLYMQVDTYKSHYLTSPNRIMEYSLCGLPFISVNQVSSQQLSEQFGHVVFYKIHDYQSLSNAIQLMQENLSEMRKNAQSASASFSWEKEYAPVIAYYRQILN